MVGHDPFLDVQDLGLTPFTLTFPILYKVLTVQRQKKQKCYFWPFLQLHNYFYNLWTNLNIDSNQ